MSSFRYFISLLALCCLLLYLPGCKKDEAPPQILVTSPADNNSFAVGDSIPVLAQITHSKEITSVKISLLNADGIPILVPKYIYPSATSYTIDYEYPINKNLESGTYSLMVSAGDGITTTRVYTAITIAGVGRYFEQLIAVCRPNNLKTNLYGIDADGNYENILNLDHGYTDSDISSGQRQLYMLKPSPDILFAYNLDSLSEIYYSVTASPPHPQYNSVSYYNYPSLAYVPNGNGEIRGYDQFGSSIYVTPVNVDTIPVQCWKHDNVILAFCERRGGPARFIRQYYSGTGVYRIDLKINFNIEDLFSLDPDLAAVFGNNDTTGRAYIYDVTGNALYSEIQIPDGYIRQVVQISEKVFLIAHENGIYKYDYNTFSISMWLPGVDADVMVYDELRQYVYYAVDERVYLYRYSDAALLQEVTLPNEVLNLLVQYNL